MTVLSSSLAERVEPRRFTRQEYERLAESGIFDGEPIELLNGVIVPMAAQGGPHNYVVRKLNTILVGALRGRAEVAIQSSLGASDDSEPEPDVYILPSGYDPDDEVPTRAVLVIEVCASSRHRDTVIKPPIYARAAIPQFVVVDIEKREARIWRDPAAGEYGSLTTVRAGGTIPIDAFPDIVLGLDALLPRPR